MHTFRAEPDDSSVDSGEKKYCDSVTCSFENGLIENAEKVVCDNDPCEEIQCCQPVCAYFTMCPIYFCTPAPDTEPCDPSGCTHEQCCKNCGEHNY